MRNLRLAANTLLDVDTRACRGATLQCPSGLVRLNLIAATILRMCDGSCSQDELVARLARMYGCKLATDAREFLHAARTSGWVVELAGQSRRMTSARSQKNGS